MTPKLNLQTLYFPQRLADDLENIKIYPLTVLEAPSGFGKTTALEEFFSQKYFKNINIYKQTFFSQNTEEYWQRFCQVLAETDPICAEALKGFKAPNGENFSEICDYLRDLECLNETYIFLDNLSGAAEGIDMFLSALSNHSAKKLHIAAAVQSAAAKNSLRFKNGGRAYFVGAAELAFSAEDCLEYFSSAGILLTDSELKKLVKITDGWIFAVHLQLLFYSKNKRFEKDILNTLIEKAFFERLTAEEKKFYITLSLFKSFTVRQAADLCGKDAGFVRTCLEGGGFIHYDGKKQEYYFHNLLFEFLQNAFEHLESDEKNRLRRSAAEWEERFGKKINAIRLYYEAGEYEKIFSMPHTSYDLADIEDENTHRMIFNILDKTPGEVKLKYPESMVPLAFILFFINENQKLGETVEEIFELVEKCNLSEERKNAILGETEFLISFTAYNDIAEMSRHHQKAYKLLGGKARLVNLQSTWSFGSPSVMCLYHSKPGGLDEELALMDECMPYYYRLTGGHGNGSEYAMRAEAEFLRGNLDTAETLAHRAIFEARSKNQSSIYQCGLFVLGAIAVQRGDETGLFDAIFSMSETAALNSEDMCRYTPSLFFGYIYAFTHRCEKVEPWLEKGDFGENRLAPMTVPFAHMIYARILLEKKEYVKLIAFCPFACKTAQTAKSVLPQIYFNIFAGCAYLAKGDKEKAKSVLKKALSLAEPDGIYMPFAQCFSEIKGLLKDINPPGYEKIYRLGTEFEKSPAHKPRLSPREKEVAELIRQGLTNKEIAMRLYVSLSTVKMTISNIFDKTGIKSRAQLSDLKINN